MPEDSRLNKVPFVLFDTAAAFWTDCSRVLRYVRCLTRDLRPCLGDDTALWTSERAEDLGVVLWIVGLFAGVLTCLDMFYMRTSAPFFGPLCRLHPPESICCLLFEPLDFPVKLGCLLSHLACNIYKEYGM